MTTDVADYELVVSIDGKELTFIKRGYLSFMGDIEKYPWVRATDVNGVMHAMRTTKINHVSIVKLERDPVEAVENHVAEDDE
jgi:hypothetical protein